MSSEGTNGNLKAAMFYRSLAVVFGAILLSLLTYIGNQLLTQVAHLGTDINRLTSDVSGLKSDIARYTGEQSADRERVDRANGRQIEMDRRLTIIETKMDNRR